LTQATFKPLAKLQMDSVPAALELLEPELPALELLEPELLALELLEPEPELLEDDELAPLELLAPALDPVELEPLLVELLPELSLEPTAAELPPLEPLAAELVPLPVELVLLSEAELAADDDASFELEACPVALTPELEVEPAPAFDISSVEPPDDPQPAMRPDAPRTTKAHLRRPFAAPEAR
jgi:hypothetical protein